MKPVTPIVVGRGMAGSAIMTSVPIIARMDPELELSPVRTVERGRNPAVYISEQTSNALFLANPSGMHAASILQGLESDFDAIAVEKPACVTVDEIDRLKTIHRAISVYHGYRVLWGPRKIREMVTAGELGDVFCFEARYWQSSSAQKSLRGAAEKNWKDDPSLNGPRDTLTDLGSHIVDLCLHLMSDQPIRCRCRLFYRNAPSPHRDTHVHLTMQFPGDRQAVASISKTLHGSGNDLEFTVLGTRGAATWKFMSPDEVVFGEGSRRIVVSREAKNPSSGSLPFHGLGWLEGYVEITHQTLRRASGLPASPVPDLTEALRVMDVLLKAEIET